MLIENHVNVVIDDCRGLDDLLLDPNKVLITVQTRTVGDDIRIVSTDVQCEYKLGDRCIATRAQKSQSLGIPPANAVCKWLRKRT